MKVQALMQSKLQHLGIPYDSVKVFGSTIHVRCFGRDTADTWQQTLGKIVGGMKVKMVPSMWEAAQNKGTCLVPTMCKGFLISAQI